MSRVINWFHSWTLLGGKNNECLMVGISVPLSQQVLSWFCCFLICLLFSAALLRLSEASQAWWWPFSHPPIVHCQHQFISCPPTIGLPLVTVWSGHCLRPIILVMTSHMGQYTPLVVMTAVGYTGQYGPQHDWTLRKWHSGHDIQIIGYQGYKTEQAIQKAQST